jgi:PAS domain S-box-containing protein
MKDQKRIEAALLRSEMYLTEAQRLSGTGSFGWNVASGEIVWSDQSFRIFGADRTTKPTVEFIIQRTNPEDRAAVQQTISRASVDGKDFDHEYRLLMPDGSAKYVHAVARAVRDASGNIEFVGAVTDVTTAMETERNCGVACLGRIGAVASHKQLGMGCATSRVGVSFARNVRSVWIGSGTGRSAAAGVPGSHSSRR